jgi:hypothetical protein
MKKALAIVCFIAVLFLAAAPSAFAVASATDGTLTLPTTNVTGAPPSFTFKTSPNVRIDCVLTATNYGIVTTNDKTDTTNGQEFGVLSTSTGYALRTKTVAVNTAAPTPTALALPGTGWGWMGGS